MRQPYIFSYDEFNRLYKGFTKSREHKPTIEEKKCANMSIDDLVDKLKRSCE